MMVAFVIISYSIVISLCCVHAEALLRSKLRQPGGLALGQLQVRLAKQNVEIADLRAPLQLRGCVPQEICVLAVQMSCVAPHNVLECV